MSDITLGIIGSGQLGSLLCQAAKKLNVKTFVISDDEQGLLEKLAIHYSAKGLQNHHHKSGLFGRLFNKND